MRSIIIQIILLLIYHEVQSQVYTQTQLDSLDNIASVCDSSGVVASRNLETFYHNGNNKSKVKYYLDKRIKCVESRGVDIEIQMAYHSLLIYHLYSTKSDSIFTVADHLSMLLKNDTMVRARRLEVSINMVLAVHFFDNEDDVDKGYSYYREAREIAYRYEFHSLYFFATRSLLEYYREDGQYNKAIELADETLSKMADPFDPHYRTRTGSKAGPFLLEIYQGVKFLRAQLLLDAGNNSISDYELVHKLGLKQISLDESQNKQYNAIAIYVDLLIALKDYLPLDTLLLYGTKALEKEKNTDLVNPLLFLYHGQNLYSAKNYEEARQFLRRSVDMLKEEKNRFVSIAEAYSSLVDVNNKLGEGKLVADNFRFYKLYSDSLYERKNRTAVEAVETKYELKQQEAENRIILQESESLRERMQLFSGLGLVSMLSFFLALTLYLFKRRAAKKLAVLNNEKNKIFAILAHDLKSPIANLSGMAEKVEHLLVNNRLEDLRELTTQTEAKLHSLNENLNNILLWAITESNLLDIKPETFYLSKEIERIIDINYEAIAQKEITITNKVSENLKVYADLKVVQTILRNLISNAIKFSYRSGSIEFNILSKDRFVELLVSDTGIGIEKHKEVVKKDGQFLTEPFTSTGIGLKICKELCRRSNLSMNLVPNPKGGAVGMLMFPGKMVIT